MSVLLSECSNSRDNNFNLMRFLAASLVLYSHSFAIQVGTPDAEPLRDLIDMTWGTIAVDIFFVTSGFLIAGSFFNKKSLLSFVWARVLRIYPALIVANLFCVFVVGLSLTNLSASEYLTETSTYKFLIKNSTLVIWGIQYDLPGLFRDVPAEIAVNGSLWTLPYEVKMYFFLACIGSLLLLVGKKTKKNKGLILIGMFSLIAIVSFFLNILNHYEGLFKGSFLRLFFLFFVGSSFYVLREKVILSGKATIVLVFLLFMSFFGNDTFFPVYCVVLPYFIFYIAYVPGGFIRLFNRLGDYSYGMYIYAYPIQQSIMVIYPEISIVEHIIYSFFITLFLAYISWNFLEKKALAMKNNYSLFPAFIRNYFVKS